MTNPVIDPTPFRVMTVVEVIGEQIIKPSLYVITYSNICENASLIRTLTEEGKLNIHYIDISVNIEMTLASAFSDSLQLNNPSWTMPEAFSGYFQINGLGYFLQSIEQKYVNAHYQNVYPEISATIVRDPNRDVRTQEA